MKWITSIVAFLKLDNLEHKENWSGPTLMGQQMQDGCVRQECELSVDQIIQKLEFIPLLQKVDDDVEDEEEDQGNKAKYSGKERCSIECSGKRMVQKR